MNPSRLSVGQFPQFIPAVKPARHTQRSIEEKKVLKDDSHTCKGRDDNQIPYDEY